VIAESLSSLQVSLPPGATLASLPRAELRRRPNTALLKGRYQTPLGEIRFTPEGEVIQNQFVPVQRTG
jgi:branched-chain amino acid transport system substrate-binding protein